MDEESDQIKIYKAGMKENIFTVFAAALCIGLVAIGTGSLHCFWGLLLLVNLNTWKSTTK